jgi:hypothetical protein
VEEVTARWKVARELMMMAREQMMMAREQMMMEREREMEKRKTERWRERTGEALEMQTGVVMERRRMTG